MAADGERSNRTNRAGDGRIDVRSALAIGTSLCALFAATAPFVFDLGGKAGALAAVQKDIGRVEGHLLALETRQQSAGESTAASRATLESIQGQLASMSSQLTSVSSRLDAMAQQQRGALR